MGLLHIKRSEAKWNDVKELESQLLSSSAEQLGENNSETLSIKARSALTYYRLGQFDEAEEIATLAFEATKEVFGIKHRQTLFSMSTLALTFKRGQWLEVDAPWIQKDELKQINDRLERADKLEVQVMEMNFDTLGMEHTETLHSMINVMHIYYRQKRFVEAEDLCKQIVNTSTKILGSNHPNAITSRANLGALYRDLGRFDEAVAVEKEVMEANLKILGEDHPDTILSIAAPGLTYLNWEHYEEAEKYQNWALRLRGWTESD